MIIRAKLFPWKLRVVDRKEMEGWFDRESEDEARPRGGELFNDLIFFAQKFQITRQMFAL